MNKWITLVLILCLTSMSLHAQQVTKGKFCLQYFPQPTVENYVDSLVSYLTREMGGDSTMLDQTTEDYIEHFASQATAKSKCIFFKEDSILVHEKVSQELSSAYMIIPSEDKLISRGNDGLIEQPYFLEAQETGYTDYSVITDKADTKLIEGFLCYKVVVNEVFYAVGQDKPREKQYHLYVTDDIKLAGGFVLGVNMSRVIGCPLEIQEPLNSKVMISYRATGLSLSVPDGIFQSL